MSMTVKDVFLLRKQGRIEEAYDAIRKLYATDKSPYTSSAMFWTATDILKKRIKEGRKDEAEKIYAAIERMLPNLHDKNGWVKDAFIKCMKLMNKGNGEELPQHLLIGLWGEEIACAFLRQKGYVILERDWHSGHRDIDIVAKRIDTIVFVEVKTRSSSDLVDPVSSVGYDKQRNLKFAINHYIKSHHVNTKWRFDVITIVGKLGTDQPDIEHLEDFPLLNEIKSGGYRWHS